MNEVGAAAAQGIVLSQKPAPVGSALESYSLAFELFFILTPTRSCLDSSNRGEARRHCDDNVRGARNVDAVARKGVVGKGRNCSLKQLDGSPSKPSKVTARGRQNSGRARVSGIEKQRGISV